MLDSASGQSIPQIDLHSLPLVRRYLLGGCSVLFCL